MPSSWSPFPVRGFCAPDSAAVTSFVRVVSARPPVNDRDPIAGRRSCHACARRRRRDRLWGRARELLATLTFASWNEIRQWLSLAQALRYAA